MSRYAIAGSKASGAAAAWVCDLLRTGTSRDARIFEIGIFAETAVAGTFGIARTSNAGTTPGGSITPQATDSPGSTAALGQAFTTYGTPPTVSSTTPIRRSSLPATIGAGVIWTFPAGLVVPTSTFSTSTNGLALWQFSALAVTYGFYVDYDE